MKTVVVTGGTRGLGLDIVRQLAASGYKAIAVGRHCSDALQALIDEHQDAVVFECYDFNEITHIHDFARRLSTRYGRIYGLVNNAALGHDGVLATMHESQIGALIRINVEAPILLTKYLIRPMLANGTGRVINISSIIASTGFSGLSVYGASKAAIVGFTRSLAREIGKVGITVNAVAPGFLETDMTANLESEKLASIRRRSPLAKLAKVDDVANGVLYLLSDAASSVTGIVLTIDAGSTA